MSDITLEALEELFDRKMDEKLEPIKEILAQHTSSLDELLTEKKTKSDNDTVAAHRLDRLEHWAQIMGQKFGVKLKL